MLFLLASAGSLLAQEDLSKALNDLARFEYDLQTKAKKANLSITDLPYRDELSRKAAEVANTIDIDKVSPDKSDRVGRLFVKAQKHREAIVLFRRFLTTNQPAYQKEQATQSILDSYYALGDASSLRKEMEASSVMADPASLAVRYSSLSRYFDLIAKVEGVDQAIKSLDVCAGQRTPTDHKEYARRALKMRKDREANHPPKTTPKADEERLVEWEQISKGRDAEFRFEATVLKVKLLSDAGRTLEADAALKEFAAASDLSPYLVKRATNERQVLALLGQKAPVMPVEKKYGGFEGFEGLKGKVVLMDFYGPLWSARGRRGLTNAYADLKSKGLEVLSLAPLRPFYDDRWDLTKHNLDVVRADLPWPSAYADSKEFQKAAPNMLGYLLVVDRKGTIRYIRNPNTFDGIEELRVKLEALLSEK